jgi:hypothetical protein
MKIDHSLSLNDLKPEIHRVFELAGPKILNIDKTWDSSKGTPVFTVKGRYTSRGWTEWTQGFQFGAAILEFDGTGDEQFLELGRKRTLAHMATHVSHVGVHDHGFNNISTYGNLRRLMLEDRLPRQDAEMCFYDLALKISGAVQANRWTPLPDGLGFIHSFNGPHSLFSDTMRTLRVLGLAHQLGHVLMGENDRPISLLGRLVAHTRTTARYNVYFGTGRDAYDVPGRVAHESVFNVHDGNYRCPSTQQGYSPFSTWTRGLAWVVLGFAEQAEFLDTIPDDAVSPFADPAELRRLVLKAATVCSDFFIENSCADGVPFWDTGAPGLIHMPDYQDRPSDPENDHEPVDSSAAAIAAQGFWRLGRIYEGNGRAALARRYRHGALALARTLFRPPYLSENPRHQGLLLHSVYHRPNGWDYVPRGSKVPHGESSMWGDYHALEFALLLKRELEGKPYMTFFSGPPVA